MKEKPLHSKVVSFELLCDDHFNLLYCSLVCVSQCIKTLLFASSSGTEGPANPTHLARTSFSCNFVRCLVELCRIVHICLDATQGLESSLSSSTTTLIRQAGAQPRTQRLAHFVEKSSENDSKVHPGLEIDISATMPTGSGKVFGGCGGFQLTGGYHAAAFLVANAIHPKKSEHEDR